MRPLEWTGRAKGELSVPVTDSVLALADASYLDWPELPATPAALEARRENGAVRLTWRNPATAARLIVERSVAQGAWQRAAELAPGTASWSEPLPVAARVTWRVRAEGASGASPWSNPAWLEDF